MTTNPFNVAAPKSMFINQACNSYFFQRQKILIKIHSESRFLNLMIQISQMMPMNYGGKTFQMLT